MILQHVTDALVKLLRWKERLQRKGSGTQSVSAVRSALNHFRASTMFTRRMIMKFTARDATKNHSQRMKHL